MVQTKPGATALAILVTGFSLLVAGIDSHLLMKHLSLVHTRTPERKSQTHPLQGRHNSTIIEEKTYNPRFNKSMEEFVATMSSLDLPPPNKVDVAVPANMVCGACGDGC